MWIVAVAWVYVVGLMALTEPSIVAGIMTFLGYCVLPLSILFYLTGGKARRARRAEQEASSGSNDTSNDCASTDSSGTCSDGSDGGGDGGGD
ncbi:MAG: hypothetical protein WKG03_18650 [Telluria sp.]